MKRQRVWNKTIRQKRGEREIKKWKGTKTRTHREAKIIGDREEVSERTRETNKC